MKFNKILKILKEIKEIIPLDNKELTVSHLLDTTIVISDKKTSFTIVFEGDTFKCFMTSKEKFNTIKGKISELPEKIKELYEENKV